MAIKFINNGKAELSAGIASDATSLTVKTGQGNRFPVVSDPDYFFLTLVDASGNRELVKCTARAGGADTLTIVRGMESTTPRSFSTDDKVELRLTAGVLTGIINDLALLGATDESLALDINAVEAALDTHKGSNDHDGRYFTESEINSALSLYYTKTNVQTSGQALVHAGNLTNKSQIKHSDLNNDEVTKHRIINDSGTGSTELWSASKVNSVKSALEALISGKAEAVHTHDDRYYTIAQVENRASYYATNTTHDDRYYTKAQVYTQAQVDAAIAAAISAHVASYHGGGGGGDGGAP